MPLYSLVSFNFFCFKPASQSVLKQTPGGVSNLLTKSSCDFHCPIKTVAFAFLRPMQDLGLLSFAYGFMPVDMVNCVRKASIAMFEPYFKEWG